MSFTSEKKFEDAVVRVLDQHGWDGEVIMYPNEDQLIENWKTILFNNNRSIDSLGDYPITDGEMGQILEQIAHLRTPLRLNEFINGKTISIKRDNKDDKSHYGKEISLEIYDRDKIASGYTKYQIVRQPQFTTRLNENKTNRGDVLLLINGMPVIHVELKKTGIPLSEAYEQIRRYSKEGSFTGIFSLVQIFVAMTPEETVYFANPGSDGHFNTDYYFNWADFNNEPINNWKDILVKLLSIPTAHKLIGFYTVADRTDGILKVMRSYQYFAANSIFSKVATIKWGENNQRGGFIWHTTGSGKTMTSFKSAQLIANSNDADKVVFLNDRIELATQSLNQFKGYAYERESVQSTEDTHELISKLKSNNHRDTLIVTSIQKMSNIKYEEHGLNAKDIEIISDKRLVFIVDEAHRSTFGDMLITIKDTFIDAIFFGFTGTPIHKENEKKMSTTATVFGDELHRYSIADGIRDKNVLGFDPYKVLTYKDIDIKKVVALRQLNLKSEAELASNKDLSNKFIKIVNDPIRKMASYYDSSGNYIRGFEEDLYMSQYLTDEHTNSVVDDIVDGFDMVSCFSKYHAIFATSSIEEAINYYRIFKEKKSGLKVTALFDTNFDSYTGFIDGNNIEQLEEIREKIKYKEEGVVEIIDDYNQLFGTNFSLFKHSSFKRDIAERLSHKNNYRGIEKTQEKQLDILIVVDQMLTGFDSKWINALYLDKLLKFENIIQAFSRTNRLSGHDKPHGTIKYYRKPHTMEKNIESAVNIYSGNKPVMLFVDKLNSNLKNLNLIYEEIEELFKDAGIINFNKLPNERELIEKFALLFNKFNRYLDSAKIQGFNWGKTLYNDGNEEVKTNFNISDMKTENNYRQLDLNNLHLEEIEGTDRNYLTLLQRYKEIKRVIENVEGEIYSLKPHITEIKTGRIDSEYMNNRFEKYLRLLNQSDAPQEEVDDLLRQLHKSFAVLTHEEQRYANVFLNDIQSGNIQINKDFTIREYISKYQYDTKNKQIEILSTTFGLNTKILEEMLALKLTEKNINEFGRLDRLLESLDKDKAQKYFEKIENKKNSRSIAIIKARKLISDFILKEGFELK